MVVDSTPVSIASSSRLIYPTAAASARYLHLRACCTATIESGTRKKPSRSHGDGTVALPVAVSGWGRGLGAQPLPPVLSYPLRFNGDIMN